MKNAYGVVPIRFFKRKGVEYSIECNPNKGPTFCDGYRKGADICINDNCNSYNNCFIDNDGTRGYECHPGYKKSLFVDTDEPENRNYCELLDYEVFGINYESRYTIDRLCNHPDIIWEYIETEDISEESLKQVDDDTELLSDLDAIHCKDSNIRLKISHCCLKNPSEFLPDTQIINQQYDAKLREWIGNDYQWRLIYRASEHGYTARSFHECCNDKEPTLVVIKSSGGWIFGGYTTQSWSGDGIYNKYDIFNNQ